MDISPDTRQHLVDTARELIATRSYHAVGVQEICTQAGVKKGSFYHFFASKRDLALVALDETAVFFSEAIIARAFSADIPPLARIERFFDLAHDLHQEIKDATGHVQGCPFGNIASELGSQDEGLRNKVDGIFSMAEQPIEQALQEAVTDGDLPEIDTASAACAIFAYMEGLILYAKTRNDAELIRDLGKRAIQLAVQAG
jgi:TetR/AcrR family transcriptional repressor of nem operon